MGSNYGFIALRMAAGSVVQDVIDAITESYLRRGAVRGVDGHRAELAPLTLKGDDSNRPAPLGLAVSPVCGGFVSIVDSERYHTDARLARDLAGRLGTSAFWHVDGDVSNSQLVCRYGEPDSWLDVPGELFYQHYDAGLGWSYISFENVLPAVYDAWPEDSPHVELTCRACGERWRWVVGEATEDGHLLSVIELCGSDEYLAPSPSRVNAEKPMVSLRQPPGELREDETTCQLLVAHPCRRCPEVLWVEADWDRGIVVAVRQLPCKPEVTSAYAFQWGPI